ncbi:MAG: gliding motility protein [Acidobacteria bacterium]|nr:gliding motility protein [Acidobacteriota bacterium]
MVFFNYATMQMAAKIVYYGPGLCGKTTNLHHIYGKTSPQSRGEMVSLETETDRTLFFDLLPIDVGVIGGFKTRLQLYTVPGQVFYNTTRKLVLKGVDGIVFVADSQKAMLEANAESFRNLRENLAEIGLDLDELPIVFQLNKRDLPNIADPDAILAVLDPERRYEFVESVASTGIGVFETLKQISKQTLRTLRRRMTGEEPVRPAPRKPVETATFRVKDDAPTAASRPLSGTSTVAGTTPLPPAPAIGSAPVAPPSAPAASVAPFGSQGAGAQAFSSSTQRHSQSVQQLVAEPAVEIAAPPPELAPEPEVAPFGDAALTSNDPRQSEELASEDEITLRRHQTAEEVFPPAEPETELSLRDARPLRADPPPSLLPPPRAAERAEPAAEQEIDFSQSERPAKPPQVKHVKVRTSVDIMAELESLRKRATTSGVPTLKPPKASANAITLPSLKRDLRRTVNLATAPGVAARARSVRVTVSFEAEDGALQQQEQTLELGDVSDVHNLSIELKIDLGAD